MLGIEYPVIMAPMFLVSTPKMIVAALNSGITAAMPAMNYRTANELDEALKFIKSQTNKPFGVNIIVNKSNIRYKDQLDVCIKNKVAFIITSLGNPKEVIARGKEAGVKVFCDVTDLNFAQKVEQLGADAIIAVSSHAGGHAGQFSPKELITTIKEHCKIPVISAGGVVTNAQFQDKLNYGADGVTVGTAFIASNECDVCQEYKDAIVKYKAKDIVSTEKLSGSKLTVINTPYVQKIGTEANVLEKFLNRNKRLRKYVKMLMVINSMKKLQKAAFSTTYQTVWCAGPSIEDINEIRSVNDIVERIVKK